VTAAAKPEEGTSTTLTVEALRRAEGLDEHESAIVRAVDELHGDAMISDTTWDTLAKRLDERQLIELPIIVGQYQTVAYYQNSLRLRLHTGNRGLRAR
jgi:alkylhydroperoxidase family enzyme